MSNEQSATELIESRLQSAFEDMRDSNAMAWRKLSDSIVDAVSGFEDKVLTTNEDLERIDRGFKAMHQRVGAMEEHRLALPQRADPMFARPGRRELEPDERETIAWLKDSHRTTIYERQTFRQRRGRVRAGRGRLMRLDTDELRMIRDRRLEAAEAD